MTAGRWGRIKDVFGSALELPEEERSQYLESACGGDVELRREVEDLLAASDDNTLRSPAADFLHTPGLEPASPGQTVNSYRIVEKLGAGGMGLVYRALDVRLGRQVALKFLPPELEIDQDARTTLVNEARATSALDHPNIGTIYGIEETSGGHQFIVMAYYEGQTLAQKLRLGPLPPKEAATVALQVANGLAEAHAHNIVHRDIKPSNIFLTRQGLVKILDFGIARVIRSAASTRSVHISGTLAYMSPQQAEGKVLDARTDLWSLGTVLFEMLAGRRAFAADDLPATLLAVVNAPPPDLADDIPRELQKIVYRALAKEPEDRFQTAGEMIRDLRRVAGSKIDFGDPAVTLKDVKQAAGSSPVREKRRPETSLLPSPAASRRTWLIAAASIIFLAAVLLALNARKTHTRSAAAVSREIRSIAVLPLANLSRDAEQEYFADGMTEQLITELAQISAWDVISRTSVLRYRATRKPLQEIAHELAVDAIIEGPVLRSSGRVRVTVQLIDAATDTHLWSGSFAREMNDVLFLQADIARTIAGQLNLTFDPSERGRLRRPRKVIPEAYEAYLRGCYFFDRAQYSKDASYFEQATLADDSYALAHALLSEADGMASFLQDLPVSDRSLKALERARQLDDTLAEVHDRLGDFLFARAWDFKAAEVEYRRAVELNPNSIDALLHYIYFLHAMTRFQEAEQELKRALRVDPVSPAVNVQMLALLVNTHPYQLALEQFRKVIELDPNSASAYSEIVSAYAALGREDDAVAAFMKAAVLRNNGVGQVSAVEAAAVQGGLRACLRKSIERLRHAKPGDVSPLAFASLYARLGDRENALRFLDAAYQQRRPRMIWIKAQAVWDPLRSDPRFQALLRRMGFPE